MATSRPDRATVVYPESDGKPLAETQLHGAEMVRMTETLEDYFADRPDVYVWMNMLFYYEEGNPRASVAPDVFVTIGVPKEPMRRIYKVWEEGIPPATVFEVTSPSTRMEDQRRKRALYASMGVQEYFMYDPMHEYLRPPLQGYRLDGDDYQPIIPGADGSLMSEALGLLLMLIDGQLRFIDPRTGTIVPSRPERIAAEAARAEAESVRADAETARAEAETTRAEGEAVARRAAEDRSATDAAARRAAEQRVAELEALLARRDHEQGGTA